MIVVNFVLLFVIIVLLIALANLRVQRNDARTRASRFEAQANEATAFASKVSRDNDDLRNRLREQGKTLARRIRKAEGR